MLLCYCYDVTGADKVSQDWVPSYHMTTLLHLLILISAHQLTIEFLEMVFQSVAIAGEVCLSSHIVL